MRIVDELRLVAALVVIAVQSGKEERDRYALLRVVEVIAAVVNVVVAAPCNRFVKLVVEVANGPRPQLNGTKPAKPKKIG